MLKDIAFRKVEGVAVAVVPEVDTVGGQMWNVYILNFKPEPLEAVLIRSKGYGEVDGKPLKTSVLRQFLGQIKAHDYRKIEPIREKLFKLCNEFWVSYRLEGYRYEKKYVFVPESIVENNFIDVPIIDKAGVMIK